MATAVSRELAAEHQHTKHWQLDARLKFKLEMANINKRTTALERGLAEVKVKLTEIKAELTEIKAELGISKARSEVGDWFGVLYWRVCEFVIRGIITCDSENLQDLVIEASIPSLLPFSSSSTAHMPTELPRPHGYKNE